MVLTSMFLQATFFTTAGNRSEAFFPRAIIWVLGQIGKGGGGGGNTSIRARPHTHPGTLFLDTQTYNQWEAPLTATILFMASSLRESLLVSNISFRSSCLGWGGYRGSDEERERGMDHQGPGRNQTKSSLERDQSQAVGVGSKNGQTTD